MLVGRLEILGNVDRRGAVRFDVDAATTLRAHDGRPVEVIVEDFSRTGFRMVSDVSLPVDTLVSLGLSGSGARLACVVWRDGRKHGCMFLEPLTDDEIGRAFVGQKDILANIEDAMTRRPDMRDMPQLPSDGPPDPQGAEKWLASVRAALKRSRLADDD
ncbi:MAG: hypothetical protein CMN73_02855 [Sphingomonas sp.]|nr:hypothetical protein [Sphingomonas sp.]|tara:strand:- start:2822 stop:3298 length:477 start_codon:yes stop_codon:yes gene_type:complete